MQETNSLEKQLRSWTPRRPSPKIAARLFPGSGAAEIFLHPMRVWNWLTPLAACAFAFIVAVHGSSRHLSRLSVADDATFFATLGSNGVTSNLQPTLVLSSLDENMEWNVWPHPFTGQSVRWPVPTNR